MQMFFIKKQSQKNGTKNLHLRNEAYSYHKNVTDTFFSKQTTMYLKNNRISNKKQTFIPYIHLQSMIMLRLPYNHETNNLLHSKCIN